MVQFRRIDLIAIQIGSYRPTSGSGAECVSSIRRRAPRRARRGRTFQPRAGPAVVPVLPDEPSAQGTMTLKQLLGLDTRADRYAYGVDPVAGHLSAQRIPDKWIATTCGYCSVGCGMFIGVRDGRAVSVRGNPDHPVNRGMLCPKGLSEHHTIR